MSLVFVTGDVSGFISGLVVAGGIAKTGPAFALIQAVRLFCACSMAPCVSRICFMMSAFCVGAARCNSSCSFCN
jgi:hypothetical protein